MIQDISMSSHTKSCWSKLKLLVETFQAEQVEDSLPLMDCHSTCSKLSGRKICQKFWKQLNFANNNPSSHNHHLTMHLRRKQKLQRCRKIFSCPDSFIPLCCWWVRGFDTNRLETLQKFNFMRQNVLKYVWMCVKIYVKCALCKHIARLISDSGLVVAIGKECPKQLISAEQDGEAAAS